MISTAYLDEPAMQPLADTDAALEVLERLEGKTSLRQNYDIPPPAGVRQDELLTPAYGYGWTYVNAAFCYTRSKGNRFNGSDRGAWYATFAHEPVQTAIAEVGHHLTRELANVGIYENVTRYRELIAGFIGPFVDLRSETGADYLDPDENAGHPAGQALARELREADFGGAVYPSVRYEGGVCLAAFWTTMVQNIRQGAIWELSWSGSERFTSQKL
ncbi:RES family NAD+ phosphorylase [Pacificimonas sp. ICDLI1SI03]